MAEAITGRRTVLISTDDASRRALRSVGKVAATTGDVIHLARAPRPDARTAEVMAHELTHVAHPSDTPRFFDDDHRGPEERRAEQVGRIMSRSPLAPTAPIADPGRGAYTPASTVSRTADPTLRRSPSPTGPRTVTAAALAAQITGSGGTGSTGSDSAGSSSTGTSSAGSSPAGRVSSRSEPAIRRSPSTTNSATSASTNANPGAVPSGSSSNGSPFTGMTTATTTTSTTNADPDSSALVAFLDSDDGRRWFRDQLRDNAEVVFRALESHMIVELERRGGRSWGGL